MAELKTQQNEKSVDDYINAIAYLHRRADCKIMIDLNIPEQMLVNYLQKMGGK